MLETLRAISSSPPSKSANADADPATQPLLSDSRANGSANGYAATADESSGSIPTKPAGQVEREVGEEEASSRDSSADSALLSNGARASANGVAVKKAKRVGKGKLSIA